MLSMTHTRRGEIRMAKKKSMEVSAAEVVDYLRITGRFSPAVLEVVGRKVTVDAAKAKKMKVTAAELQKASDGFRVLNGLSKAKDTEQWLKANGISVESFESYLESNVLISKFKAHLLKESSKDDSLMSHPVVQESIGELVYQDWISGAVKENI